MKKLAPQSKALSGESSLRVERIWKDFVVLGGKLEKKFVTLPKRVKSLLEGL